MKVRVLKDYVGRNSGLLHKAGAVDEWSTVGKYGRALIDNGFVEIVTEAEEWKPKYGENFWVPGSGPATNINCSRDKALLDMGLAFKTEEESKHMADWLKAVKVLRRDSDKSMRKALAPLPLWFANQRANGLVTYVYETLPAFDNPFPFSRMDDAEKSIKEHMQEWLTFFKFMND